MKTTRSRMSLAGGLLVIVGLVWATSAWSGASETLPSSSDEVEIESVVRDYIEGWYAGDVERMDRALHADLVKRIPVTDSLGASGLRTVSRARMLELTEQGGGENPDAVVEIIVHDVSNDIATAQVASPEYLDYLHLARTPEGWKIVDVLFRMRD